MNKKDTEKLPHIYGDIFLDEFNAYISDEDFLSKFKGAEFNYSSLAKHEKTTPSWGSQFLKWKRDGILD